VNGRLVLVPGVALCSLTAACATVGGLESARGQGDVSYYRSDPETVFDASVIALSDLGLSIARLDREAGHAAAEASGGMWSYGEVVGVFVRRSDRDDAVCSVEVVSRKRLATNVLAKNWEDDVLERIDAQFTGEARLIGRRGETSPPSISRAELRGCLEKAEAKGGGVDERIRKKDLRECREEGAGDSTAVRECLQGRETARTLAGIEPDMDVLNECLREERKDFP